MLPGEAKFLQMRPTASILESDLLRKCEYLYVMTFSCGRYGRRSAQ